MLEALLRIFNREVLRFAGGDVFGCIYEALPSPPYSHEDTGIVAERVYDYVWQRSASGHLSEGSLAA